ncbi:MAG: thiamine phosphate synthase [Candidatus Binatia bacterium]
MPLHLPPLYGILDPEQIQGRTAEIVLREMLGAGVTILQLRVKSLAPVDFLDLAKLARAETRAHNCKLIVNDRIDVALACEADGVHLGQEDLPLSAGRKLMGPKIVGISTHDLQQAEEAERNGADYIGFGPIFGTMTKATGYAARGVDLLKKIRAAIKLPIVAIGGITEENVQQVWQARANSAAIISDILHANDIPSKVTRILRQRQASQQQ